MSDTTEPIQGTMAEGGSLEEVAKMGPLPGVLADDQAEERGEDESTIPDEGRGILGRFLPHRPSTDRAD